MSTPESQSQASSSQDPTSVLRSTPFSMRQTSANTADAFTATDLLTGSFDPAKLHPLADLKDQLEYLSLDDDKTNDLPGAETALPSRGWSDDLCYGTGTTYLSGLAIGGMWGLREGARRPLAVSNARLRINSVLNSVTRRGSFMGNSAGVVALGYNAINSAIDHWRGKHDVFGSMAAGGLSGALYKSTAGVRPALAAGAVMTGLAGMWSYVKKAV